MIEPGDDRRDPELRWNARRGERGEQQNDAEQGRGAAHGPRYPLPTGRETAPAGR